MSITVAVTTYNALDHLKRITSELRQQGFNDIVVLDDASTDDTAVWLTAQPELRSIIGATNLGPTGNRNRIRELKSGDIILFIDVDMSLISSDVAPALEAVFEAHPKAAVVTGVILGATDEPMWYNWGYEMSPRLDGFTEALNGLALAHWDNPAIMATVRELAEGRVGHFEPVIDREIDWAAEGFFAVRRSTFDELDGFDPVFRMFHEGPDYCLRARRAGYTCRLTATVTVRHLDLHSGSDERRAADMRASTEYYYRKNYQIPDTLLDQFFVD